MSDKRYQEEYLRRIHKVQDYIEQHTGISYTLSDDYENDIIVMLLEMLSAYDESHKVALLDLAIKISHWLIEKLPDNSVCYINYLQAEYRKSKLKVDEVTWLEKHIKKKDTPKEQKLGCTILLEKYELCDFLFSDFSKEEQENFSLFPIMNLWKREKEMPN